MQETKNSALASPAGVHRLDGDALRVWWHVPPVLGLRKRQYGAYYNHAIQCQIMFLFQLPFAAAIMVVAAGGMSAATLTLLMMAAAAWLSGFILLASIFSRHRYQIQEVVVRDDGLELRSPFLRRRVSWLEIEHFCPSSSKPSGPDSHVLLTRGGERFVLWESLSDSESLFQIIASRIAPSAVSYGVHGALEDSFFDMPILATWAIMLALSFNAIRPLLLAPHALSTAELGALALMVAVCLPPVFLCRIYATRIPQLIRAGEQGLYIRTREKGYDIPWNQVTALKRLGSLMLISSRAGWFLSPYGKEEPMTVALMERKELLNEPGGT